MIFQDLINLARKGLKYHKIRTYLTLAGIIISIAAVYAFLLLGEGVSSVVEQQIMSLGSDIIRVTPAMGPVGDLITFDSKDEKQIKGIPGVRYVMPVKIATVTINFDGNTITKQVFGIKPYFFNIIRKRRKMKLLEGKEWKKNDYYKLMLGHGFAKYTFDKEIKAKDKLIINNKSFTVSGILEPGEKMLNDIIAMHIDTLTELVGNKKYNMFLLFYDTKYDAEKVKEAIEEKLSRRYDEDLFMVMTPKDVIEKVNSILGTLTMFVILIAGVSLIVSAVSIANTMYASVLQRTKEIGIMKAVGAKDSDVLRIFIIESTYLGVIGGIIGVISGYVISKLAQYILEEFFNINVFIVRFKPWAALGLVLFSAIVGMLAGLNPARKASKIDPVDALRYE